MAHTHPAPVLSHGVREKLIIALDVPTAAEARDVVAELKGAVGAFKVGLQLFTACGPGLVRELADSGAKIFLDLKYHDIPNTVAAAAAEATRLGVWMFNVHAAGGSEMMLRTVDAVEQTSSAEGLGRPLVIAVTVLTSSDDSVLAETGIGGDAASAAVRLARLAADNGLDGVVASPRDVAAIKGEVDRPGFLAITPGIRPFAATGDDQKRVTTFRQALANGSDHVVVGRPVLQAADKLRMIDEMVAEANRTGSDD